MLHKWSVDSMKYQATRSDVPGAVEACQAVLDNEAVASEEIFQFSLLNPPDKAYIRKQLLDWARFVKKHGVRASSIDRVGRVPITEKAFIIRKTTKEGLTQELAQELWNTYERTRR